MIPDEPVKRCYTCHEIKPLISFYQNKSMRDGFSPACKFCHNKITTRCQRSEQAKAKRAVYSRSEAAKEARKKYRLSEKGKAPRNREASRRRERLAVVARESGDYKRNDASTRQLRSLCNRLVRLIFRDVT